MHGIGIMLIITVCAFPVRREQAHTSYIVREGSRKKGLGIEAAPGRSILDISLYVCVQLMGGREKSLPAYTFAMSSYYTQWEGIGINGPCPPIGEGHQPSPLLNVRPSSRWVVAVSTVSVGGGGSAGPVYAIFFSMSSLSVGKVLQAQQGKVSKRRKAKNGKVVQCALQSPPPLQVVRQPPGRFTIFLRGAQ